MYIYVYIYYTFYLPTRVKRPQGRCECVYCYKCLGVYTIYGPSISTMLIISTD